MRTLSKPKEKADEFYLTCISRVRNKELKSRLKMCEKDIIKAFLEYEKKVTKAELHTIELYKKLSGKVTTKEMNDVYTKRMVPKSSPGRPLYDKLLNAPAQGICPLCGQRTVTTLDHHLPKAIYPNLSVVPVNLIPACKDCNTIKLHDVPTIGDEETIHPYFDDIEDEKWLFSRVIKENPVTLIFEVVAPTHWDPILSKRVENHFDKFQLAPLYSSHAVVELQNIRHFLTILFETAGSEVIEDYLIASAESREKEHINSWQSAMYRALAEDKWFQTEGILLI